MENKVKAGTATIDINEYDRLMKVERDYEKEISVFKNSNNEIKTFLKNFLICFGEIERENAISVVNDICNRIDYKVAINSKSGERMVLGTTGKIKLELGING